VVAPIPDDSGWLPEGVHETTLDEIRESFGSFRSTDRRPMLFSKLQEYLGEVARWSIASAAYVDGSFVSTKASPGDVDLVLCVREEFLVRQASWTPTEVNLVSRGFVKRNYEIDLFPRYGEAECRDGAASMFVHRKPPEEGRKGVLVVRL